MARAHEGTFSPPHEPLDTDGVTCSDMHTEAGGLDMPEEIPSGSEVQNRSAVQHWESAWQDQVCASRLVPSPTVARARREHRPLQCLRLSQWHEHEARSRSTDREASRENIMLPSVRLLKAGRKTQGHRDTGT